MSDTTATTEAAKSVAVELGKFVAKSAAQTAVEIVAATAVLASAGFIAQKVQDRRASKNLAVVSE